jgi:hypothetical protein
MTIRFNDNVTTHLHDKVPTDDTAAVWWTRRRWNAVTCGPSGTTERIEAARASALMNGRFPRSQCPNSASPSSRTCRRCDLLLFVHQGLDPAHLSCHRSTPSKPVSRRRQSLTWGATTTTPSSLRTARTCSDARSKHVTLFRLPDVRATDHSPFPAIKEAFQRAFERTSPFEGRVVHPPAPLSGLDSYSAFSVTSRKGLIQRTLVPTDYPQTTS